ncbi:hypothetical protein Hanom_Chr02g00171941 [Helianthus anomalus]
MEKVLNGLKMGGYNLRVNIAKLAAENAGWWDEDASGRKEGIKPDGTGQNSFGGVHLDHNKNGKGGWLKQGVSFKDILNKEGRAMVGRVVDLQTLSKMKDCFKEAGLSGNNIHYLGGLSLLVSFEDESDAEVFVSNVTVWSRWFASVDMWAGQTMQYERVSWLKFHGMPLHLSENKVFDDVAGLFGRVIHKSQLSLEDKDLSVSYVGILVDHGNRIEDSVKWSEDEAGVDVSVDILRPENEKSDNSREEGGKSLSQNHEMEGLEEFGSFNEGDKSAGVQSPKENDDRNVRFASVPGNMVFNKKNLLTC